MRQSYVKNDISRGADVSSGVPLCPVPDGLLYGVPGVAKQIDLDTLAQLGKKPTKNQLKMMSRAYRKAVSDSLKYRLLEVKDSPLRKSYLTSTCCCGHIDQVGQAQRTIFCNYRWCYLCNNIRAGILTNRYGPAIKSMSEPVFLTLTRPPAKRSNLKNEIIDYKKCQSACFKDVRAKRIRCGRPDPVNAISRIEANYNRNRDSYNVHSHMVIDGYDNAVLILEQWLKKNKSATIKAQDIRRVVNPDDMPAEMFKYFVKTITDKPFNAVGMDGFFQATHGKRLVMTYGNIRAVSDDVVNDSDLYIDWIESKIDRHIWQGSKVRDWCSVSDGDLFSEFVADSDQDYVISNLRYKKRDKKNKRYETKENKQVEA